MENKKEKHDPIKYEPVKACELYQEMLSTFPKTRHETIGGGLSSGMSSSGNAVFTSNPKSTITTYDKDTNDLLRAKFACDEGMLVSPLSTSRDTLFVKPAFYESHAKEAERLSREKANHNNNRNCIIQ